MSDDRRPIDEPPTVRFESRLPRGDRSPLVPVAALGLLVAIAIVTSRPAAPGGAGVEARVRASGAAVATATAPGSVAASSVSPADAAVATICLEPGSWRTATIETWRDRTVRVWRAIDPTPASGPDDPAIPIVPAVGSRIEAIGFCAPVVGVERPAGPATVEAWRRGPPAAIDGGPAPSAAPITLRRLVPADSSSSLGGLFGPAGLAEALRGWAPGVVVFRYDPAGNSPPDGAIWFGIEIVRTDAAGRDEPP